MKVLHVANWYPNPWNPIEGNFVRDQIQVFREEVPGEAVAVQVRHDPAYLLRFVMLNLDQDVRGYYLITRLRPGGKGIELLTTILLLLVLLRHRAWSFSGLHFHIAIPLLAHASLWRPLWRKPILISEHWSAYHYNFYLREGSKGLAALRRPFQHGLPVLAVSRALLDDIRQFSGNNKFPCYVIPNVVPLHGTSQRNNKSPVLFTVNRWVDIKNPMPMLEGIALALEGGAEFELVIGGGGPLLTAMKEFVRDSILHKFTSFLGWMSKSEIACELACADGYLFSSLYETFSIACAEALGAGLPLIGPFIPAIAEYAGNNDWVQVESRTQFGWRDAIFQFMDIHHCGSFKSDQIAQRAADHFSPHVWRGRYRRILAEQLK